MDGQRVVSVDTGVVLGRPAGRDSGVGLAQVPVDIKDFLQIFAETGAVLHQHTQLLDLKYNAAPMTLCTGVPLCSLAL